MPAGNAQPFMSSPQVKYSLSSIHVKSALMSRIHVTNSCHAFMSLIRITHSCQQPCHAFMSSIHGSKSWQLTDPRAHRHDQVDIQGMDRIK